MAIGWRKLGAGSKKYAGILKLPTLCVVCLVSSGQFVHATTMTCSSGGSPITLDVANSDNGGQGCEATNLFFSNFLVTTSGSGNAPTGAPGVQILGTSDSSTDPTQVTATFSPSGSSGQFSWNETGVAGGSSVTTAIDFLIAVDPSFTLYGYNFFVDSATGTLTVAGLNPGDSVTIQQTLCPGLTFTPCSNSYSGQVGSFTIIANSSNPSGISTGPVNFLSPATVIADHVVITINLATTNPGDLMLENFTTTFSEPTVLPEPSTLGLSATALAGLALLGLRQKRR